METSLKCQALAEQRRRQKAESLGFDAWLRLVSPVFCWDWSHLAHIRQALQQITDGSLKRLMLFLPPRHGKSLLASEFFLAWYLGRNDVGVALIDPESGSCSDGLHADRINANRGAESVVSYLLALAEIRKLSRSNGSSLVQAARNLHA